MKPIEGVGPEAKTVTTAKGGMHSHVPYAFHLLPPESLFAAAEVFDQGAKKYARDNWRQIDCEEHINHAITHLYAYLAGDIQDAHLEHALCRVMMAVATKPGKEEAGL